jgi:HEAT repeat protein
LYNHQYASIERSWVSIHLRGLHHDEAAQRVLAAENLGQAGVDDATRVVSALALALALDDSDWRVRRGVATSLTQVIRRSVGSSLRNSNDEIKLAMMVLLPALDDLRAEVRIAAMRSVSELADLRRASSVVPGSSTPASAVAPEVKRIAAALLRAMSDTDSEVRAEAVRSLRRIGPLAGLSAAPIERAADTDPALEVRSAARWALVGGWPEHSRNTDVLPLGELQARATRTAASGGAEATVPAGPEESAVR